MAPRQTGLLLSISAGGRTILRIRTVMRTWNSFWLTPHCTQLYIFSFLIFYFPWTISPQILNYARPDYFGTEVGTFNHFARNLTSRTLSHCSGEYCPRTCWQTHGASITTPRVRAWYQTTHNYVVDSNLQCICMTAYFQRFSRTLMSPIFLWRFLLTQMCQPRAFGRFMEPSHLTRTKIAWENRGQPLEKMF